ncbi:bifunctional phosphoribosylaminoimidazolecarboxamide formyltransferase/IMP cyclohydrolase [Dermabacter sp. HSID17554]|uniref:bifunctional phosphoribosylaminoimidazolecarboxamide formyltransferase/IMP cyclohydrolase n=1 Tax=Dermabacter sp. HSID17554 TaxID=2419511 RepID=UPI001EE98F5B|nr:bifunctional phosphoribosylaminoimidazolecarboxamide formyltransferase/IMP cyclohydrolase [Dermabacter sp. HSID17554]
MSIDDEGASRMSQRAVTRALVSVYDKTGLTELATTLHKGGVEIVSTGSTAKAIAEAGIPVTAVESVTGFPEILDGRVKTLHPKVHGGLLADRDKPTHVSALEEHEIAPIDLLVCNLYPFEETVASGASFEDIVEKIDIGGPAMVRSAAKNFSSCAVITSTEQYDLVEGALASGGFTREERLVLAADAFSRIAEYDAAIEEWMAARADETLGIDPQEQDLTPLRYGENSHQQAFLDASRSLFEDSTTLAEAELLNGKAMSYNNYVDADAALRAAFDHPEPCVAIIKHNNPCGIAITPEASDVAEAYTKAHATDPVSAFGGVIAVNRPVSLDMAKRVTQVFTEVIVAPGYEDGALDVLKAKKNLRILEISGAPRTDSALEGREIWGGVLYQESDRYQAPGDDPENWELVCGEQASEETLADLAFAWRAVRAPRSNAILLAKNGAAVGVGMGQVNRVDACRLAVERANTLGEDGEERARGAVAASDAFFPFADGPEQLIAAGITAIVQPGGSIRDREVIDACQKAGITMYTTGTRHFAH